MNDGAAENSAEAEAPMGAADGTTTDAVAPDASLGAEGAAASLGAADGPTTSAAASSFGGADALGADDPSDAEADEAAAAADLAFGGGPPVQVPAFSDPEDEPAAAAAAAAPATTGTADVAESVPAAASEAPSQPAGGEEGGAGPAGGDVPPPAASASASASASAAASDAVAAAAASDADADADAEPPAASTAAGLDLAEPPGAAAAVEAAPAVAAEETVAAAPVPEAGEAALSEPAATATATATSTASASAARTAEDVTMTDAGAPPPALESAAAAPASTESSAAPAPAPAPAPAVEEPAAPSPPPAAAPAAAAATTVSVGPSSVIATVGGQPVSPAEEEADATMEEAEAEATAAAEAEAEATAVADTSTAAAPEAAAAADTVEEAAPAASPVPASASAQEDVVMAEASEAIEAPAAEGTTTEASAPAAADEEAPAKKDDNEEEESKPPAASEPAKEEAEEQPEPAAGIAPKEATAETEQPAPAPAPAPASVVPAPAPAAPPAVAALSVQQPSAAGSAAHTAAMVAGGGSVPPAADSQPPQPPRPPVMAAGSAAAAVAAQQQQLQQQEAAAAAAQHPAAAAGLAQPAQAQGGGAGGGHPPPPQMRELKVEDALLYLDQVKLEFGDRPRIYNEFLEIMKNFKAQEIDTPGVIRRVSTLFRGYNNLILGFNTFLPEGYKIELKDLEAGGLAGPPLEPGQQPPSAAAASQQQQHMGGGGPGRGGPAGGRGGMGGRGPGPAAAGGRGSPYQTPARSSPQGRQQQPPGGRPMQPQPGPMGGPPPPQAQQQPPAHAVEFDHAIAYVTTIKKRFANDPRTYQTFLEILHTYQKEQRGIKEVLEQVSNLFADHPDLLKEFTFFLPDAVQEQAKERLARAAAEAEERKRIMLQAQAAAQAQLYSGKKGKKGKGMVDPYHPPPPPPGHKFIDMTQPHKGMSPGGFRKRGIGEPLSPADYVYNAGVERQFFDAAKEALTSYSRDGGQAWAEFLKCLDMYAQEVLSRSEMLGFVEPLLGKRNIELFEEFKRILANAGVPGGSLRNNAWHSVPLSEIDFSRCRRCSPSYRALPRDYPAPPCSERSVMEKKVLNDVWVSLPVGSEESYTFRHMRKNQHEELLFRVEDERFEIDMCIDSNATALLRLEPIAEEIAQLNNKELITPKFLTAAEKKDGTTRSGTGFAGKKFQYTLDKRTLTVIHRHAIVRIYGDAGEEMFDLLFKNPTMAVPVVVKRLRQKDREWKAARDILNIRWKELAEIHYYKSIDHQSMTWRTSDKRATSTRTLVAEIKDRAANKGEEGDAAIAARRDKMKEEFGSFYEVTMGRFRPKKFDMSKLPPPSSLFTPHMTFVYEDCSWAQKDAYRILTYSLERGSISPMDKERCHRVWRDFLAHLFGMNLTWMQAPALAYASTPHSAPTVVSNGEESGEDDEDDDSSNAGGGNGNDDNMDEDVDVTEIKDTKSAGEVAVVGDIDGMGFLLDQQPIPAGTQVSTTYGEGSISSWRKSDGVYEVQLAKGGSAYLRADAILCTIDPVQKSPLTEQCRSSDSEELASPNDRLVIGTQSLYLFFRLHQILVKRLATAKALAYKSTNDKSIRTHVEQMVGDGPEDIGRKRYDAFLSMVYGLIEGGYTNTQGANEGGKFEERVRCLLGQGAYELATIDKLINHIQKHLQQLSGDETMHSLIEVYRRHADAGSFKPNAFKQEAAYISDGENMFAFQYCPMPSSDKSVMFHEYLGDISSTAESSDDNGEADDGDAEASDSAGDSEPPTSKRQRRS